MGLYIVPFAIGYIDYIIWQYGLLIVVWVSLMLFISYSYLL